VVASLGRLPLPTLTVAMWMTALDCVQSPAFVD
jgi:hypothetical protein